MFPNTVLEWYELAKEWVVAHGLRIFIILVIAIVVNAIASHFIKKLICRLIKSNKDHKDRTAEKKREDTLIKIFVKTVYITVWIVAGMMILSEFGVAIGPLMAAAGIAGLAFGFGGQYLIRDLISGVFIIVENQYRVGDAVCFDSTCGAVEDISLRMTTLRDLDGVVHHIPHGEIKKVSNMSKEFSRVNLNVGVAYDSDMEKVESIINKIGEEMMVDEKVSQFLITAPKFLRIDDFADSAIVVKILCETLPLKQWEVAGDLRKRIKVAFDKEGISIPFPQRDVRIYKE